MAMGIQPIKMFLFGTNEKKPVTSRKSSISSCRILCRWGILILSTAHAIILPAYAQTISRQEYNAAFLFHLANFVTWPENPAKRNTTPIVIGVLDGNPLGKAFEKVLQGKAINQRPILLKRFASVADIETCHLLYLSISDRDIIDAAHARHILTVSDIPHFAKKGGIVGITLDNPARFEINLDAADEAGIRISSQLLSLARIVRSRRGAEVN
jgi:hypothetical protein